MVQGDTCVHYADFMRFCCACAGSAHLCIALVISLLQAMEAYHLPLPTEGDDNEQEQLAVALCLINKAIEILPAAPSECAFSLRKYAQSLRTVGACHICAHPSILKTPEGS